MLVAAADECARITMAEALLPHGLQVTEISKAGEILAQVQRVRPRVAVLDTDLGPRDVLSLTRMLRRNPQTHNVGLVIVYPAEMDPITVKEYLTAGAFAVVPKPLDEESFCRKIQGMLALSTHVAGTHDEPPEKDTKHCPTNSSLLMQRIACPLHAEEKPLYHYVLRSGKVLTELNFFDVPLYTAAVRDATYVNYHLLAVTVCPTCFFASNNPACFLPPGRPRTERDPFDEATKNTLFHGAALRRELCPHPTPTFFTEQRSPEQALAAYCAAIRTSQQLHECSPQAFPLEPARIGNYHLRLALLAEQSGATRTAIDAHHEQALEWLKKAYLYVQGAAFYRNAYQVVALAIYLGQDAVAYPYLTRLRELAHTATMPAEEQGTLQRYLAACHRDWENRDAHRLPAT